MILGLFIFFNMKSERNMLTQNNINAEMPITHSSILQSFSHGYSKLEDRILPDRDQKISLLVYWRKATFPANKALEKINFQLRMKLESGRIFHHKQIRYRCFSLWYRLERKGERLQCASLYVGPWVFLIAILLIRLAW
jgi:hypothetical protein